MIRFAVCDDEPYMLEEVSFQLTKYISEHKLLCHISKFSSGGELLKHEHTYDVIFLDVQMDEPDGMETARRLREQGYAGVLVFITVLKESVYDAFEVQAFGYLTKPLDLERFQRIMERIVKTLEQKDGKSIIVQKGNTCIVIPFKQITYCEVLGRKIYLHRQNGEVVDYYDKLEDLETRIDRRFFKCHRSYLVNLDYVCGFRDGLVTLSNGEKVPVSRLREKELTQALLVHMKERRC